MKISNRLFITLFFITVLSGCAQTASILTPHTTIAANRSTEQVETAILETGKKRRWVMAQVAPGVIEGRLTQRGHTATIRINYDTTHYTIHYLNSTQLKAREGKIHRKYNKWVDTLDREIQCRLSAL